MRNGAGDDKDLPPWPADTAQLKRITSMKALVAITLALGLASVSTAEAGHRSYGHSHSSYGHSSYGYSGYRYAPSYRHHSHVYAAPYYNHSYRYAPVYSYGYSYQQPVVIVKRVA